ncbi:MAG TPA: YitT family protein [Muribaculaceae bacterium]|jgi:uncharacterized membrane-anchored protein YitT (DUF2179 family)|nr:YitT family protein [Muribaculaceae bacterium]
MNIDRQQIWMSSKDYIIIALGIAIYAFGFCAFILPYKVVIGGLAGLGTIVYFTTGIPVAIAQFAMNMTLLAIAFKTVGKTFVIRTIYGAVCISLFIGILQPFFPEPLVKDQPFLSIVIGGLMCGFAVGTAFVHNGSTGGTDIVAAMASKKTNVSVGRMMLYTDVLIISSSFLLFHEIEKTVFGFVVLFLTSYVADMVINTNRQAVQFTIFSSKWEEIATAINDEANRGCTVISGMGWYSKHEVKVLLVMCRKIESVTIFRIIKSIDNDAFITQANVNGVYGKGFDKIKLKMKPAHTAEQHTHRHTKTFSGSSPDTVKGVE